MLNRLPQPSPLQKRQSTFNSFGSMQGLQERFSDEKLQAIPSLVTKLVNLSSQVQIQHNISSFNLIEYQKDQGRVKNDEHMAAAKLKRIENNVQLKRANMELFMRKRKMQRIKEQKNREIFQETIKEEKEYHNIFKTFAQGQTQKKLEEQENSFEEEDNNKNIVRPMTPNPDGILYFDQLKKHPKLLNYTMEKVKAKNMRSQQEQFQKRDRILKFRNEMRTISHSQPRMNNKNKIPPPLQDNNTEHPQIIFQNMIRKIYTKKNHNRSLSQAKKDQRLSTFMQKQEEILEGINQKSLSKQNYKRLKERFGDLLNELYQVDKKHRIQEKFQKKYNVTVDFFRQSPQLS